ncbi:DUF3515 family protein [Sphaerisporangium krabiense]|uniref:DUF3515 domain-containing protein n=1 Tax=Sphaerisporangium krabiense TaxID=763782 RepID=A0A7W8Z5W6_9ACTN|nr:DUF3515 family protein [Sphaerisporangium krabiense]MBB5627840.1 hypothetical protein [Sphaerisporangium krabiense]
MTVPTALTAGRTAAVLSALTLLSAACGGAVRVEPPAPQGDTATACAAMVKRLPGTLDGAERVPTEPASPYVAVWGQGEIALRCGVQRPAAMDPMQQVPEIDGVPWFADPARPALFTAVNPRGYVEVTISRAHDPSGVLIDLAPAIKAAFPPAGTTSG